MGKEKRERPNDLRKDAGKVGNVVLDNSPYSCPVCYGKGMVSKGFYESPTQFWVSSDAIGVETCRSCSGRGIVWR